MTDFQFNCMTTANRIMAHANKQHHLAVHKATARIENRAANRREREMNRAAALDTAVMAASVVGIAVATWFLTSIGAA